MSGVTAVWTDDGYPLWTTTHARLSSKCLTDHLIFLFSNIPTKIDMIPIWSISALKLKDTNLSFILCKCDVKFRFCYNSHFKSLFSCHYITISCPDVFKEQRSTLSSRVRPAGPQVNSIFYYLCAFTLLT